jgi:hypothetical protein
VSPATPNQINEANTGIGQGLVVSGTQPALGFLDVCVSINIKDSRMHIWTNTLASIILELIG